MFFCKGKTALASYAMKYIERRWPKLDVDGRRVAMAVYSSPGNIAVVGRSLGLLFALDNELPLERSIAAMRAPKNYAKPISSLQILEKRIHNRKVNWKQTSTIFAIIGALQKKDAKFAGAFMNKFIFGSVFDTEHLVKPLYPIVKLTDLLRAESRLSTLQEPTFKLLRESGRRSNESMYVVGVFLFPTDNLPLAEGTDSLGVL